MKGIKLSNTILAIITVLSMLAGYTQTAYAQDEVDDIDITGTIVSIDESGGSFVVETETGEQYTIYPESEFDFSSLQVEQQVKVEGTLTEDGSVSAIETEVQESESDDPDSDNPVEASVGYYCSQSEDQHPNGAKLAEQYEMDYTTIQTWFCEGSGWGEIMLAMKTSKRTGVDAVEMIAARKDGSGWGEIWQEAGLIGKPDKEDKVKPNVDKTPGPPEDKEKKPKKDK